MPHTGNTVCHFEKMAFLLVMPDPVQNPQGTGRCEVIENYVNVHKVCHIFGHEAAKKLMNACDVTLRILQVGYNI